MLIDRLFVRQQDFARGPKTDWHQSCWRDGALVRVHSNLVRFSPVSQECRLNVVWILTLVLRFMRLLNLVQIIRLF